MWQSITRVHTESKAHQPPSSLIDINMLGYKGRQRPSGIAGDGLADTTPSQAQKQKIAWLIYHSAPGGIQQTLARSMAGYLKFSRLQRKTVVKEWWWCWCLYIRKFGRPAVYSCGYGMRSEQNSVLSSCAGVVHAAGKLGDTGFDAGDTGFDGCSSLACVVRIASAVYSLSSPLVSPSSVRALWLGLLSLCSSLARAARRAAFSRIVAQRSFSFV